MLELLRVSLSSNASRNAFKALRRLGHRRLSTLSPKQLTLLDRWSTTVISSLPRILEDHISISKVRDLYSTIPTRSVHKSTNNALGDSEPHLAKHPTPALDAPLSPGHSLIFFHPHTSEAELAPDQTSDAEFGPPNETGFTRRMWASGGFTWNSALKMGRDATAKARVLRVERKGFEKGKPMVFVHQEIEYGHDVTGAREDAPPAPITERRVHVYLPGVGRNNIDTLRRSKPKAVSDLPLRPIYSFSWTPTATTLFRFSALTFNAHLIHLDKEYSQNVEGYPERLVHGPLTSLMLLEAFQHMTKYDGGIGSFEYRAQNPVIVGREQHILGDFDETGQKFTIWAQDSDGVVGMTGTITFR